MIIYESQFIQLEFDKETGLSLVTWSPNSINMGESIYKTEMMNYLQATLKAKPDRTIIDTRLLNFPISPELQTWTNETFFPPILGIGLTKAAFLVSSELVTQLSIEQTMEEANDSPFITQYFDDIEEAKTWISSL